MQKILFFLFFLSTLNATTLKIATYNVENLFDLKNNGTEYKEYKPNKHNWSQQKFKKKLLNISEVICDVNADIIGLQEIENENVLKLLKKSLKNIGCIYKYHSISHKKKSAIQVAILSKIPIVSSKEIIVSRKLKYRNILETKFIVDDKPFYIFNNHWTSKRSDESKRIKSARTLVHRIKALPKKSEYLILGDFNNDYDEYFWEDTTAINHVLKTINKEEKFFRTHSLEEALSHYNLWLELVNYKRWSHNFYGNKQALDAIVLPSTLFDGKGLEYVNDSFSVFKKSYLFHKKGYIFRWEVKKGRHKGKGYSDHLPVYALFSTSEVFKKQDEVVKVGFIDELYDESPHFPLLLKEVKVITREKNKVLVSQRNSKKNIIIYGVEKSMKLNNSYDLMVYGRKMYKGEYEVIDFEIEKRYDSK